ncbi:endolytic transglycosylase MltG [Capnocytophaga sp. oral taxon 878]|uniref:endolytic transglycosylase MltG n=1 Tax=Capnocytophaga sp. oral taxon 878 TaxID=1316596 RepID=UPI000D034D85|nr:endolytic transglycosylase MltG [Capnocytophaga sp. oral taxon 878]AVM49106.1 endolytic transglycosylase MltG [Capnocytophaga sp. oral taxon 878]
MKKKLKWITLAIVVLVAVIAFLGYRFIFAPNTAFDEKEVAVYIATGSDFSDVQHRLNPLLKNPAAFEQIAHRMGYTQNVKAGKYIIKKGANNIDIVRTLRNRNIPVKLKFNNQERIEDLAGRISKQIEADSTTLLRAFLEPTFLKNNGFTDATALAMYLPNTYEFYWNTSAEDFRDRMLKEYQRFWTDERKAKAKAQGLTPVEVCVLASVVQKETAKVDERPRIAGVYLNRLHSNMMLQADPTAIFAMKNHTGDYTMVIKRVTNLHTSLENPYNTYQKYGLPIGIITMPDISSIEAVLNPEKHDYLYFVADPQNYGYHKFSRTYLQHLQGRSEYIKWADKNGVK